MENKSFSTFNILQNIYKKLQDSILTSKNAKLSVHVLQ